MPNEWSNQSVFPSLGKERTPQLPGEKEGSVSWGIGLRALHDKKRELVYFNLLLSCPATGVIRHCFMHGLEPGQAAGVGHTQDAPGYWLLEA